MVDVVPNMFVVEHLETGMGGVEEIFGRKKLGPVNLHQYLHKHGYGQSHEHEHEHKHGHEHCHGHYHGHEQEHEHGHNSQMKAR